MRRVALDILLIVALAGMPSAAVQAEDPPFAKLLPSTVWVEYPKESEIKIGTGSLVDREQRLVVTCLHVMHDNKQATVYFPIQTQNGLTVNASDYLRGKSGITGRVVATDADRDLAVLQLDRVPAGVPAVELADRAPAPGTPVFAIGNSTGAAKTIAQAKLWNHYSSKVNRLAFSTQTLENDGNRQVHTWAIVLEDRVSPGDSGGPLVDAKGRLTGVVFAQDKDHGYAIDVEEVRLVLDRYRHPNEPSRQNPLTGRWTVQVQPKDKPVGYFRVNFQDDGRLDWITNKTFTGQFELKQDRLKLVVPSLKVNETVTIDRTGDDKFSFLSGGVQFTVTRR